MSTENIDNPVPSEEATPDNSQPQKYADDGAESLDNFLSDTVGEDYLEQVSEREKEEKGAPKEGEPVAEEKKEVEADKETQSRIDTLVAKSETEGISVEDIAFLKEHGYDVEEEPSAETEAPEEEGKEKEEEKPVEFQLPQDFTSELDDFFEDDENYDPDNLTVEDRLRYASTAIKTMRGNQSKLQQVFDSSPEVAGFIADMVKGVDPKKAISNNMPELLEVESAPDPTEDKEAYDKWVIDQHNANIERKRVRELQQQQQSNLQKSISDSQAFVVERKLSDPKKQEKYFAELDKHLKDIGRHHISKEFMNLVLDGMTKKKDVEAAERAGEVKGMNKKIKLVKRTGDGLVRIKSAKKSEPKRGGVQYKDEATAGFAALVGDD